MMTTPRDLPTPIQTKWIAIAGGACSGKTTIAEKLSKHLNWPMIPDFGRQVIQNALLSGVRTEDLVNNPAYYQGQISDAYIEACRHRPSRERVISDYGLPCVYAWSRAKRVQPSSSLIRACDEWRYDQVFMLSPLPMKVDEVREEAVALKSRVLEEMKKAYRYFGYDVVHVPTFDTDAGTSIQKRFEYILAHVNGEADTFENFTDTHKQKALEVA